MASLIEATAEEARLYLMEPANYVNFDLPKYFDFTQVLQLTSAAIGSRGIHEVLEIDASAPKPRPINPQDIEGVNYKLIGNKDGEFAWRPYEIIHPALYVALVNELTAPSAWTLLQDRFSMFRKYGVRCESIPFISEDKEKHKAHQVKLWWEKVEQESLRTSLHFNCVYDVDIADCYGSIYTHSIAWALHGKEKMKQGANRKSTDFLGNRIDWLVQKMRHGQTNGIPQGSTIMDFIAEMLLGYIDMLLTQIIDGLGYERTEYSIIRYRDDYRIFTNSSELGRMIVKELSSVLSEHGLKLNSSKTRLQTDPVLASVKQDKQYELFVPDNRMTLSKKLMQIYKCADAHPNSGLVTRQLHKFYRRISDVQKLSKYDDANVMIGIVVNLALKNPKSYQWSMAILSRLIDLCPAETRLEIIEDIRRKFLLVPNTGILDIWLQRISYKIDPHLSYKEGLARIASGDYHVNVIWKCGWLKEDIRQVVLNTPIVERVTIESMLPIIQPAEVALFNFPY